MKITFIKAYDFPIGGARQNRALGICRGLIEQGHKVEVHVFAPSKLNISLNHKKSKIYKSVKIINHSWRWSPAKNKRQQVFGILEGLLRTLVFIVKSHRSEHIDYIFYNGEKKYYILPIFLLTKLLGARLGRDLNEYPQFVLFPNKYNALCRYIKRRTNYRWFDVLFIMTKTLINYYRPLAKKKIRILHLPVTVDLDRFPHPVTDLRQACDITYCGDLSQTKDGIINLIEAFALIKDDFPKTRLKLIGHNKDASYMTKLKNFVENLELSRRAIMTGFVNPEQMPEHLYASRLLVLARPDSVQARGGFPTKLGEYLATGVPVVVTAVGELPNYLMDGRNAFIAKPDSAESFADAMRRALSDDTFALKVGRAGRETAVAHFSHSAQGKLISNFLSENIKNRES